MFSRTDSCNTTRINSPPRRTLRESLERARADGFLLILEPMGGYLLILERSHSPILGNKDTQKYKTQKQKSKKSPGEKASGYLMQQYLPTLRYLLIIERPHSDIWHKKYSNTEHNRKAMITCCTDVCPHWDTCLQPWYRTLHKNKEIQKKTRE